MITQIDKNSIKRICEGDEKAFSVLYDAYYTYLNAIALCYIPDRPSANEVVNDVFISIWNKRKSLLYPIHAYLVASVRNGCLNYIRMQQIQERVLSEHKEQLLHFQEEYLLANETPLHYVEMQELESEIRNAVSQLPERCRQIFEQYFYTGIHPEDIAHNLDLNISTVRVQLKNAFDRLKPILNHLISFFL